MKTDSEMAGAAALSMCESLLLTLNDKSILTEAEIIGLLRDAAQSHTDEAKNPTNGELHAGVADLINKIINGQNSVHRRD